MARVRSGLEAVQVRHRDELARADRLHAAQVRLLRDHVRRLERLLPDRGPSQG